MCVCVCVSERVRGGGGGKGKGRGQYLDGGRVALEANDLADKHAVADTDKFVHGSATHALGNDDCGGEERVAQATQH